MSLEGANFFKGRGDTDGTFAELGSERNGSFLT